MAGAEVSCLTRLQTSTKASHRSLPPALRLYSLLCALALAAAVTTAAQKPVAEVTVPVPADKYALDQNSKAIDDVAWRQEFDPIAEVQKVVFTGLPDVHAKVG